MKTEPIRPAQIVFSESPDTAPQAPAFGDIYHPRIGALAQARHVFLQGNNLPARWAGRTRFVILETGFGLGNNFLATWQAWRDDSARCGRLFFVSIEKHPPSHADLTRAHVRTALPELAAELLAAWPPPTPNIHALDFEDGRVRLLLALGDVGLLLPALRVQADAFFLDGFAPVRNPDMWQPRVLKALGRKANTEATLATWSVARELREGLTSAGFEVRLAPGIGGKREITLARYAPRHAPRRLPLATAPEPRSAIVVGAGLAGAAVAQALAREGLDVTVLDRHAAPASETSGNPAGLFHGAVHPVDGSYARLFRAAALAAARAYASMSGATQGLLRLDPQAASLQAMQTVVERLGLPSGYVEAVAAAQASALAGVSLASPAWHYRGGGWIDPVRWVRQTLAETHIRFRGGSAVDRIARDGSAWQVLDAAGTVLAQAPVLVLACSAQTRRLIAPWCDAPWPLNATHGQVTFWRGGLTPSSLRMPVAGDGYAIPLPDGGLLCGATRGVADLADSATLRAVSVADHTANLQRLRTLCGMEAPHDHKSWQGRTGWRTHADDRMPIAGAVPLRSAEEGSREDHSRLLQREPGLFVVTALGARGLTLAPLLGRLVAAQATGSPWPLEQDLADAVDPGRWRVRAARRQG